MQRTSIYAEIFYVLKGLTLLSIIEATSHAAAAASYTVPPGNKLVNYALCRAAINRA